MKTASKKRAAGDSRSTLRTKSVVLSLHALPSGDALVIEAGATQVLRAGADRLETLPSPLVDAITKDQAHFGRVATVDAGPDRLVILERRFAGSTPTVLDVVVVDVATGAELRRIDLTYLPPTRELLGRVLQVIADGRHVAVAWSKDAIGGAPEAASGVEVFSLETGALVRSITFGPGLYAKLHGAVFDADGALAVFHEDELRRWPLPGGEPRAVACPLTQTGLRASEERPPRVARRGDVYLLHHPWEFPEPAVLVDGATGVPLALPKSHTVAFGAPGTVVRTLGEVIQVLALDGRVLAERSRGQKTPLAGAVARGSALLLGGRSAIEIVDTSDVVVPVETAAEAALAAEGRARVAEATSLLVAARERVSAQDWRGAAAAFEGATRHDPTLEGAWEGLLGAHQALGDLPAMQRAAEGFAASFPRSATAHLGRSIALSGAGRADEALAAIERAIELAPFSGKAHWQRACVLVRLGRLDDAVASVRAAAAHGASSKELRKDPDLAPLAARGDLRDAAVKGRIHAAECQAFERPTPLPTRIEDALALLARHPLPPERYWANPRGASAGEIAAVEEALGVALPEDLRRFLGVHDGVHAPSGPYIAGTRDLADAHGRFVESVRRVAAEMARDGCAPERLPRSEGLLAIGSDASGHVHFVLDRRAGEGSPSVAVLGFDEESPEATSVKRSSLGAFLAEIVVDSRTAG